MNAMRVGIDRYERIVVPKALRERFGLGAGVEIELEETGAGILLSPVEFAPALIRRDGMLVYTGKLASGIDDTRLVESDREERMRETGGW